jgi:hypothetical protein
VFVGKAGGVAIAAALDSRRVLSYACDGRRLGSWFKGRVGRHSRLSLRAGSQRLTLTGRRASAARDTVVARFRGRTVVLRRARSRQGLYRSENVVGGSKRLGGWIVLPGGRQVGVVAAGTRLAPAPQLSTTSLTAGSLIAGAVVAPSEVGPLVVDLGGDGLNITGTTTTSLLGGGQRSVRWTAPQDDDTFVAFESAVLKSKGYILSEPGRVLARGGIRVTRAGVTTTAVDGLHFLRLLNGNGDGILSPADPAWDAGRLFTDANADGVSDAQDTISEMNELQQLSLQARLDTFTKHFMALSNALKKFSEVAVGVISNLK